MEWSDYDAVLFDLDGVLTPTADIHMRAWSELFNTVLTGRGVTEPYTDADYFAFVDGKPRYDGVASFLASRGLEVPYGDPADPPDAETVCGLGNRKNALFNEVLARDGIAPYPGSVRLLDSVQALGKGVAVVSSSKNARTALGAAGLLDRFEVIIDGLVAAEEGLPGKPAPDTFAEAARRLGSTAERSVVVEDAVSGVRAGRAGAFGLVVGVDRGVGAEALTEAGADVVVTDLEELR